MVACGAYNSHRVLLVIFRSHQGDLYTGQEEEKYKSTGKSKNEVSFINLYTRRLLVRMYVCCVAPAVLIIDYRSPN